eukprot:COSAG01_NODE_1855_length_9052_cov_4.358883_2_plen_159_part_00
MRARRARGRAAPLRVRVEIMGSQKMWNRREISASAYDDRSRYLHPHPYAALTAAPRAEERIVHRKKCGIVGKSQPVRMMIDPVISTRTRRWMRASSRTECCSTGGSRQQGRSSRGRSERPPQRRRGRTTISAALLRGSATARRNGRSGHRRSRTEAGG